VSSGTGRALNSRHRRDSTSSQTRRGVLENFGYVGVASAIGSVLALVATAHVARVLGAQAFGTYNLARAIVDYAFLPVALGVTAVAIREIAGKRDDPATVAGRALTIRLSIGSLSLLAVLACAFLIQDPALRLLVLVLSPMVVSQSFDIGWLFTAYENQRPPAVINTVGRIVYFVLVLFLVRVPGGAWIVAVALVVELSLTTVLQWSFRPGPITAARPSRGTIDGILGHWRRSLPIGAGQLAYRLKTNVDVLLLGVLAPRAQVGVYSAGYRLVLFVNTIATILASVLIPRMSRAGRTAGELSDLVGRTFRLAGVVGLGMAVGGASLAGSAMSLLFGDEYASGGPVLAVLMVGAGFIMVSSTLGGIAIAVDRSRRYAQIMWAGVVLNLAVNLVAIPRFGILGAAWATMTTEAFLGIAIAVVLWKDGVSQIVNALWVGRMAICALVCGLLLQVPVVQDASVLVSGSVFLLAYAALVLATGLAGMSDLRPPVVRHDDGVADADLIGRGTDGD
jgi:O-antigen/teichoic acid export membrane protein